MVLIPLLPKAPKEEHDTWVYSWLIISLHNIKLKCNSPFHWANLCSTYPQENYSKQVSVLLNYFVLFTFNYCFHDHNFDCTVSPPASYIAVIVQLEHFLYAKGSLLAADSQNVRQESNETKEQAIEQRSEKKSLTSSTQKWHTAIFWVKKNHKYLPYGYSKGFQTANSFVTTVGVRDGELVKYGFHVICCKFLCTLALPLTSPILAAMSWAGLKGSDVWMYTWPSCFPEISKMKKVIWPAINSAVG